MLSILFVILLAILLAVFVSAVVYILLKSNHKTKSDRE